MSSQVGFTSRTEKKSCFIESEKEYVKCGEYNIVRSKQGMENVSAYCALKRNHIDEQDVELIKAILVQGIFLFLSSKQKNRV
ncbi:MAG: hypothetical protein EOM19_03155 [Candidatus Moranbacteria bacterium]|nr:hypothetical protein [Candidatus Moranbacteria bacterium]